MFDLEDAKKRGAITRDGRKVRIICTDKKCARYTIVGLVENRDGTEEVETYTTDGQCSLLASGHPRDLQNLPLEREVWVAARGDHNFSTGDESYARDWVDRWRETGIAAGYAKVTIPLTK